MATPNLFQTAVDAVLDRSVVLGYTRLGSSLRSRWWPADPAPGSLDGEHVLVTGATSGIGEAMAASFVALGATVHVLGRNPEKTARVAGEVGGVVEVCDLGDLDAVRAWAADFATRVPRLRGVVHNAGAMPKERTESPQGHELGYAVHVLGPHLLTHLLLGPLRASPSGASVVWMSSGGMYGATLHDDDVEFERGTFDGVQAYARTKRMQVVLAAAWAEHLESGPANDAAGDVRVESMHPGWVKTPGVTEFLPTFDKVMKPGLRTPRDGADTAVWLVAQRPASRGTTHFWHDRALRPTTVGWDRPQDPARVRRLLEQVVAATDAGAELLA